METFLRVLNFLRGQQGLAFCDDCVAKELRARPPLTDMLDGFSLMSTEGFERKMSHCSLCAEQRLTILMVPGHFPSLRRRRSKLH